MALNESFNQVSCMSLATPSGSKNMKSRPSWNLTKFDWVIRFRETVPTVKSVLSSEI